MKFLRLFVVTGLLAVLIANRVVAKIPFGPLFLVDVLIVLGFPLILWSLRRHIGMFKHGLLIIVLAVCWLVVEEIRNEIARNNLRRSAMAIYMLIPALVLAVEGRLYRVLSNNSVLLALSIGALTFAGVLTDLYPSFSAQVMVLLLLLTIGSTRRLFMGKVFIIFVSYCAVVSGTTGDASVYRAQVAGLMFAVAVAATALVIRGSRRARRIGAVCLVGLLVAVTSTVLTFRDSPKVAQFIAAAAGLVGAEYSISSAAADRERGDAAGTAETRVAFWAAVIAEAWRSPTALIAGNGHSQSFFEKTMPNQEFVDSDVLEPHNSLIGIFYRYGLMGVALFLALLWKTRVPIIINDRHRAISAASYAAALFFACFEVVLEGPHGAVVFWTLWLVPRYLAKREIDLSAQHRQQTFFSANRYA